MPAGGEGPNRGGPRTLHGPRPTQSRPSSSVSSVALSSTVNGTGRRRPFVVPAGPLASGTRSRMVERRPALPVTERAHSEEKPARDLFRRSAPACVSSRGPDGSGRPPRHPTSRAWTGTCSGAPSRRQRLRRGRRTAREAAHGPVTRTCMPGTPAEPGHAADPAGALAKALAAADPSEPT